MKSFETERLVLKPTSIDDGAFICRLMNMPKWIQYIGDRNVKTEEEARIYIQEKMLPQLKRIGFSNFTVIRKLDSCKIGSCSLYDRDGLDEIDVGYAFLPEYEGQGYAYEASSKLVEIASHEFGIEKMQAITSKENYSSQKLLKKLGFYKEGNIVLPNETEELLVFRISNIKE